MRSRVCVKCSCPMRLMHYDDTVSPPVVYYVCPRDCAYAEGVAQRSLVARARRRLARGVAAAGRRFFGW